MNEFDNGNDLLASMLSELNSNADSSPVDATVEPKPPEEIEQLDNFSYDGYQVVRREFFAHIQEPSITFSNFKVYVNQVCVNKLPDVEFVQMLVNSDTKILAIRPCEESDRDSFPWAGKGEKRKPKQITCRVLFALIMNLMNWNPEHRYKLTGKLVRAKGDLLFVFDLTSVEVFYRQADEEGNVKTSRHAVFPAGWEGQFGLPFEEHQKSLKINTFEGYAVLTVRDKSKSTEVPETQDEPVSDSQVNKEESFNIPIMINEGGRSHE